MRVVSKITLMAAALAMTACATSRTPQEQALAQDLTERARSGDLDPGVGQGGCGGGEKNAHDGCPAPSSSRRRENECRERPAFPLACSPLLFRGPVSR